MVLPFEPLLETKLAPDSQFNGYFIIIIIIRDMVVLPKIVVKIVGFPLIFERKTSTLL